MKCAYGKGLSHGGASDRIQKEKGLAQVMRQIWRLGVGGEQTQEWMAGSTHGALDPGG